jgi:2-succinyl-5-enolpyruvyl-6-hydroxy-3-cyclohexene-1-carboxylate synthase
VVCERGEAIDPAQRAAVVIEADERAVCAELLRELETHPRRRRGWEGPISPEPNGAPYAEEWLRAEQKCRSALEKAFAANPWSEPLIAREAARSADLLYVSSSMPVRDVDAFAGAPKGRVLVNRGLNGIDGIISSAAGASWILDQPATVLLGDLAFLHDLSGLVAAARSRSKLNILCINNDGGGIFHFLPIAKHAEVFEPLFGTPHGLQLEGAAKLVGARYVQADNIRTLQTALQQRNELQIIEARTDRAQNVEQHRALQAAVLEALQ